MHTTIKETDDSLTGQGQTNLVLLEYSKALVAHPDKYDLRTLSVHVQLNFTTLFVKVREDYKAPKKAPEAVAEPAKEEAVVEPTVEEEPTQGAPEEPKPTPKATRKPRTAK